MSKKVIRDGTTHVLFQPLNFIARLAALIPKPWFKEVKKGTVGFKNDQYVVKK